MLENLLEASGMGRHRDFEVQAWAPNQPTRGCDLYRVKVPVGLS